MPTHVAVLTGGQGIAPTDETFTLQSYGLTAGVWQRLSKQSFHVSDFLPGWDTYFAAPWLRKFDDGSYVLTVYMQGNGVTYPTGQAQTFLTRLTYSADTGAFTVTGWQPLNSTIDVTAGGNYGHTWTARAKDLVFNNVGTFTRDGKWLIIQGDDSRSAGIGGLGPWYYQGSFGVPQYQQVYSVAADGSLTLTESVALGTSGSTTPPPVTQAFSGTDALRLTQTFTPSSTWTITRHTVVAGSLTLVGAPVVLPIFGWDSLSTLSPNVYLLEPSSYPFDTMRLYVVNEEADTSASGDIGAFIADGSSWSFNSYSQSEPVAKVAGWQGVDATSTFRYFLRPFTDDGLPNGPGDSIDTFLDSGDGAWLAPGALVLSQWSDIDSAYRIRMTTVTSSAETGDLQLVGLEAGPTFPEQVLGLLHESTPVGTPGDVRVRFGRSS